MAVWVVLIINLSLGLTGSVAQFHVSVVRRPSKKRRKWKGDVLILNGRERLQCRPRKTQSIFVQSFLYKCDCNKHGFVSMTIVKWVGINALTTPCRLIVVLVRLSSSRGTASYIVRLVRRLVRRMLWTTLMYLRCSIRSWST